MSVMGRESVAWEFAVFEQDAFLAAKVACDQQMSISRTLFGRVHDSTATPVST